MSKSATGKIAGLDINVSYGLETFSGNLISDTICIAPSTNCVEEFKFMAITNKTNTTGLDYQDGILGLSPDET